MQDNINGPAMTQMPQRNHVRAVRTIGANQRCNPEVESAQSLSLAQLVGKKKENMPKPFMDAIVKAVHNKKVGITGTPASRRLLAATIAVVESAQHNFRTLDMCWLGSMVQRRCCVFKRDTNEAFLSLGCYVWCNALLRLKFLGHSETWWHFALDCRVDEQNPQFKMIVDEGIWEGLPLDVRPAAMVPEELRKHGTILVGKKKNVAPLINHALATGNLSAITMETWRACCMHVGGKPVPNAKGGKDKASYIEGAFRATGHGEERIAEALGRARNYHYADEAKEDLLDDELRTAIRELGDDGKKDFKDLWVRVNKRKEQRTANEAIAAWKAQQGIADDGAGAKKEGHADKPGKGQGDGSAMLSSTPNVMPPPVAARPLAVASPACLDLTPSVSPDAAADVDMFLAEAPSSTGARRGYTFRTPPILRTLLPKGDNDEPFQGAGLWETHGLKRYTGTYPNAREVCRKLGYPVQGTYSAPHGAKQSRGQALRDV